VLLQFFQDRGAVYVSAQFSIVQVETKFKVQDGSSGPRSNFLRFQVGFSPLLYYIGAAKTVLKNKNELLEIFQLAHNEPPLLHCMVRFSPKPSDAPEIMKIYGLAHNEPPFCIVWSTAGLEISCHLGVNP